ncbi:MAG: hypothetical protein JOY73_02895 [Actinobacteria bacterium]|nr:hypothetical protein [Actinomycetota bacterium]
MLGPWGYSRFAVNTVLGLLAFVVFIAAIIGLAAALTWVVVRFSPSKKPDATAPKS